MTVPNAAERPLCLCHREPMRKRGGDRPFPWRCAVKQRETDREWHRERYRNDFAYWVKKQIRNRRRYTDHPGRS